MKLLTQIQPYRLWLLAAVAFGLMWLNLQAPAGGKLVPAVERTVTVTSPRSAAPGAEATSQTTSMAAALPEMLERPLLEITDKDPFAPEAPKAMPMAKQPLPAPTPVVVLAPPPPPEPPPLNLLYAGRMTAPDGSTVVYATMGEALLVLAPGLDLPNGYRVTHITARAVELSYAALNRTTRLDIPPAQKYETR